MNHLVRKPILQFFLMVAVLLASLSPCAKGFCAEKVTPQASSHDCCPHSESEAEKPQNREKQTLNAVSCCDNWGSFRQQSFPLSGSNLQELQKSISFQLISFVTVFIPKPRFVSRVFDSRFLYTSSPPIYLTSLSLLC